MNMEKEMLTRIQERIRSMKLEPAAEAEKLAKYEGLYGAGDTYLSSLEVVNISLDLHTSVHWLLMGERDPMETSITVRNVLRGSDGKKGNKDWVEASEAVRDTTIAYSQVSLGPSLAFAWTEPKNIHYASAKLRERATYGPDHGFFSMVEDIFGVDVFVIDSEHDFDAIGAMTNDAPYIVAKKGLNARQGHYAVARELAEILAGNLFPLSEVYDEALPLHREWCMDFILMLMDSYNGLAPVKGDPYGEQRFPQRLIEAHRYAVEHDHNLGYFLEWMTGEPAKVYESTPFNVDELVKMFGLEDEAAEADKSK